MMSQMGRLGAALLLLLPGSVARAEAPPVPAPVKYHLAGTLIDHTHNHGADRRIWSTALGQPRDLYVYLPPGFDPCRRYPVLIWLHGINTDEKAFVEFALPLFDEAMACGRLPPMIIADPDGSTNGRSGILGPDPLWHNSRLGNFEDFVTHDVWEFVMCHYPVRPERQAHVLGGYSGGGAAAFRIGMRYRACFAVVFGIHPPLNTRWINCHGRYFSKFDPCCWGWQERVRGRMPVGRFYGILTVRLRSLVVPLYGRGPETIEQISRDNPIEVLDYEGVREGELAMYVAYGGRDEFNVTAQAECFIYRARCQRGLTVAVGYLPHGHHTRRAAKRLLPGILDWLAPQLAPYAP
jgi:hypothetical protein